MHRNIVVERMTQSTFHAAQDAHDTMARWHGVSVASRVVLAASGTAGLAASFGYANGAMTRALFLGPTWDGGWGPLIRGDEADAAVRLVTTATCMAYAMAGYRTVEKLAARSYRPFFVQAKPFFKALAPGAMANYGFLNGSFLFVTFMRHYVESELQGGCDVWRTERLCGGAIVGALFGVLYAHFFFSSCACAGAQFPRYIETHGLSPTDARRSSSANNQLP